MTLLNLLAAIAIIDAICLCVVIRMLMNAEPEPYEGKWS